MSEQDPKDTSGAASVAAAALFEELGALRAEVEAAARDAGHCLDPIHPAYRDSARNLLHYLALRGRDLRPLQARLAALGLSSLGRAEAHVLATLDAILALLQRLAHAAPAPAQRDAIDFETGSRLLDAHTVGLLGSAPRERNVRIMVTMPSAAADDAALMQALLAQGMDCIRINCAHDDPATWARMIANLRHAEQVVGRTCKVAMDLAGPKLRTGPLEDGPRVVKIRPARDACGRVTAPAHLWLTSDADPQPAPAAADACLRVPAAWLARLRRHDRITLTDARAARRTLAVADSAAQGCWAESDKTCYLVPETMLRHHAHGKKGKGKPARVGDLPARANALLLHKGDTLVVTRDLAPGRPAVFDSAGQLLAPARIGCTLPAVFDQVRAGEPIWFDDGRIGGVIDEAAHDALRVRIVQARDKGEKLRADKGINLPGTALHLDALTGKDIDDLAFVAAHADIVELSFANRADDVLALQAQLERLGAHRPGIVLKIETALGFENLPDMLLAAMRWPCCGVMIARGDLAVESGFERLAEVQEEMLWVCEAAHVPVVWATQVLESLAQNGRPSRAEITDAAMGDRAECVMLNKGPHVVDAVRVLDDILKRMQAHQSKKQAMLRMLHVAHALPRLAASSKG